MASFFDRFFRTATPAFQQAFMSAQRETRTRGREERLRKEREGVRLSEAKAAQEKEATRVKEREEDKVLKDIGRLSDQFKDLRKAVTDHPERYSKATQDYVERAATFFQQPVSNLISTVPTEEARKAQEEIASMRSSGIIVSDRLKELEQKAKQTRKVLKKPPEVKLEFDPRFRDAWLESKKLEKQLLRARARALSKSAMQTLLNSADKNLSLFLKESSDLGQEKSLLNNELATIESSIGLNPGVKEANKNRVKNQIARIDNQIKAIDLQADKMRRLSGSAQRELAAREGIKIPKLDLNKRRKEFILREKEKAIKERDALMNSLREKDGSISPENQQKILKRVREMINDIKTRADTIFSEAK